MKTTVKTALLGAPRCVLLVVLAGTLIAACAGGPATPTAPSAAQTFRGVQKSASPASDHHALLLTKTCGSIDHCTVITSALGPFPVGSDIFYSGPLLEARTTSKIVVTTPAGATAAGHCSLSYETWKGACVITDGTMALAGLHANVRVTGDFSTDPNGVFTWEGDYHFER